MNTELAAHHELNELETTIANGFANFLAVGNALLEIQARKLYQDDGYPTFEQYCAKRWSISRSAAYRMIQAAEVVDTLSDTADLPLPINEAQTRVLARLKEPEAIRAVWEEVVDEYGEAASAPRVRDAVDYFEAVEEKPEREAWPREQVIAEYRAARKKPITYDSLPPTTVRDDAPPSLFPVGETVTMNAEVANDAPAPAPFRDVHTSLSAGRQLIALDPARWAAQLDDPTLADVHTLIDDVRRWCDAMEREIERFGGRGE